MQELLHTVWHIVLHSLVDTAKLIPFLFLAYLLMEFIENKASEKMEKTMKRVGRAGPVIGSALGLFPQCGFSASIANLYATGLVSVGTVIAVFLSTSDEAVLLMVSDPQSVGQVWKLLLSKFIIALVAGFAVDVVLKLTGFKKKEIDLCENCGCDEEGGIFRSAVYHTVRIVIFIFVINLIFGAVFETVGEERVSSLLSDIGSSWYMPFITAVVGFIPNCASSIILTELYIEGALSFGAAVAGLCSGAGIGVAVLIKTNRSKRENLMIIAILYFTAVISGVALQLLGI
ncbi:MAG: arsenic efflux protein [Clostridia bacterium]|nr:arsenic efflux protein [Clostridia bacterium]